MLAGFLLDADKRVITDGCQNLADLLIDLILLLLGPLLLHDLALLLMLRWGLKVSHLLIVIGERVDKVS